MSLASEFEHIIRHDFPLAERTWLRVGGAAEFFAEPTSVEQLASLVEHCRQAEIPVHVLGGGSNLLIRDQGVRGVVIRLGADCFAKTQIAGTTIICSGGAKLSHVISTAVGAGLAGLEPLVGIPGTVGGALHGNAGSHGGDVGQWAHEATVLTRNGELIQRRREDMVFAYRQSSLDELVIVEATFQLEQEEPDALAKRMQKQWIATKANQPMSHQNTACVFKDPRGMSAEMLIEQSGLKGSAAGGAEISVRHANFIVTHPGATAGDVLKLIDLLKDGVYQRMGVELETHLEVW